jgi:hypothetical protein
MLRRSEKTPSDQAGVLGRVRAHRWLSIGLATTVGLLGGSAVAYGLHEVNAPSGPSPKELAAQVNASERAVAALGRDMSDARRVSDLAGLADRAQRSSDELDRRLKLIATSEEVQARQAAESAVRPAARLVSSVARLDTVTAGSLTAWKTLVVDIDRHAEALGAAQTAVLPGATPAATAATDAREGAEAVGDVVARAKRKLARWRKEVREFRRARAAKRRQAVAYRATVSGLLGQYRATRTDLQEWIHHVERDGATFEEGYSELSAQKDARQRIRSDIGAQVPPAALAGVHSRLLAVIGQAIDAMDSSLAGLDQLQESRNDFGPYDSYDETPSWHEFQSASDRISLEFPSAEAAWNRATSAHLKQLNRGHAPKRPAV